MALLLGGVDLEGPKIILEIILEITKEKTRLANPVRHLCKLGYIPGEQPCQDKNLVVALT